MSACVHCDDWGCSRCGSPQPPQVGEQGDQELTELDTRVAAAVQAERQACATIVYARIQDWTCPGCDADSAGDLASVLYAEINARGNA